jgi:DNA end-binding protein Ku
MPVTIWRGRLVFGLVSIPVRLYKAARRERIQFHNVYNPASVGVAAQAAAGFQAAGGQSEPGSNIHQFPGGGPRKPLPPQQVARVHLAKVGESPEVRLREEDILKGYQVEPDLYVVLTPEEVAALRPKTSSALEISAFVKLSEIDLTFLDVSYFVAPDQGSEKPYALLYRAMAESGHVAIGNFAMHGRAHAAIIRPGRRGLLLHTLYHSNEVGLEQEVGADLSLVSEKELEMAKVLVSALTAPFDPSKLKDTYQEQVLQVIQSRTGTAVPGARPEEPKRAPVVDMMDALRKSVEAVRKPAQREGATPAERKKHSRRGK